MILNRSNALLCLQGAELATDCKLRSRALAPQGFSGGLRLPLKVWNGTRRLRGGGHLRIGYMDNIAVVYFVCAFLFEKIFNRATGISYTKRGLSCMGYSPFWYDFLIGKWYLMLQAHSWKVGSESEPKAKHERFSPVLLSKIERRDSAERNSLLIQKNGAKRTLLHRGAEDRNRTGTGVTSHGILSPGRLPVPPLRHSFISLIRIAHTVRFVNRYFVICFVVPIKIYKNTSLLSCVFSITIFIPLFLILVSEYSRYILYER